ncbi:MAG TPA: 3-hydroxyisobutyrate dehydrogenase [Steroidobacteraceae bacterium]|nr:3-hydroxyisobutyrate dehydrogenase [Steroidobacteraceae bacterium]
MKIAFIGLGNMGAPMARNLLRAGHELAVYDVVRGNVEAVAAAGARATGTVREAVAGVDMVVTMLPSSPQVRAVYFGGDGVLAAVARGVRLVDSSTIDPHTAREVAARAAEQGNPLADAPVSGGTNGAEAATLTFMVGASEALFASIEPVLAKMGKKIVRCGDSGTGQVAKICNNLLLAISMIGVAEAMSLGASLGIDPQVLAGIVNSSSGRCWSCDSYNPFPGVMDKVPAARGYTGGFGSDLMLKDLGLATDAAKQARQPVVLGAAAEQLYRMFSAQGHGALDFSAIIRLYRKDGTP